MRGREHGITGIREKWTREIDYVLDGRGVLLYESLWNKYEIMEPGEPITDPHAVIAKVGMQTLNPTHFRLRPADLSGTVLKDVQGNIIGDPLPPGVSSYLYWGSRSSQQDSTGNLTQSHMGRAPRSRDRIYITQVVDIIAAGWTPYFAPLLDPQTRFPSPLHVLLVPDSMQRDPASQDPTFEEREALVRAFIPWENK